MELIPIKETLEENKVFTAIPDCQDSIYMTIAFYEKVGFQPPWIAYYFRKDHQLVGSGAFKGAPANGRVEIAYGTFENFRHQGIGAGICRKLVELAQQTDPSVEITARTLPEKNYSTRILEKNGFAWAGMVNDPEDGEVWEWLYRPERAT